MMSSNYNHLIDLLENEKVNPIKLMVANEVLFYFKAFEYDLRKTVMKDAFNKICNFVYVSYLKKEENKIENLVAEIFKFIKDNNVNIMDIDIKSFSDI